MGGGTDPVSLGVAAVPFLDGFHDHLAGFIQVVGKVGMGVMGAAGQKIAVFRVCIQRYLQPAPVPVEAFVFFQKEMGDVQISSCRLLHKKATRVNGREGFEIVPVSGRSRHAIGGIARGGQVSFHEQLVAGGSRVFQPADLQAIRIGKKGAKCMGVDGFFKGGTMLVLRYAQRSVREIIVIRRFRKGVNIVAVGGKAGQHRGRAF